MTPTVLSDTLIDRDDVGERYELAAYLGTALRIDAAGRLSIEALTQGVVFDNGGLTFTPGPTQHRDSAASLSYHLTSVQVGTTPLWVDTPGTVPTVSVTANTASLARGAGVVEWYRSRRDGLEQGFTLLTPPTEGDLLIVGTFATRLQPDGVSTQEGILFRDPVTGRVVLRYGQAWAEDHAGRRLPGTLELRGHQIAIRLPAAWLAQAVYPVTVDPLLENDLIFADGFESGDFSAWTSVFTDSGDLSVSTAAALAGTYGLQAHIDDTTTLSVRDYTPASEPR